MRYINPHLIWFQTDRKQTYFNSKHYGCVIHINKISISQKVKEGHAQSWA